MRSSAGFREGGGRCRPHRGTAGGAAANIEEIAIAKQARAKGQRRSAVMAKPTLPLWRLLKSKGLWETQPTSAFARFSLHRNTLGGHEDSRMSANKKALRRGL